MPADPPTPCPARSCLQRWRLGTPPVVPASTALSAQPVSEFEHLLGGRGLLAAPFAGRREELDEVERLLADQGRGVIIEAPGGYGKTRLAVELARSGRPSTWWFFVDYGLAFEADYLAEVEAGYP
jgi:hypothetical protein